MSEAPNGTPPADGRETARLVRNLALAAGVFVLGVVVVAVTSGGDGDDAPAAVGPVIGSTVDDYVADRHERLAELEQPARVVVSFAEYVGEADAAEVVGADVERWLVAAPGGAPQVTDDPAAWRVEFAAGARAEAAEIEELLPTVEDEEFVEQYEADIDRALEMAEALDAGDPVVFGVVITGEPSELRRLRTEPRVRLVDPVEPDASGEPRGVRPEETSTVGEPRERPR